MLTTSLAMVGGVQAVAIVPATHASVPASCTWGDIYYEIGTQSRPINITHEKYISLAPHTSYSKSTTLSLTLNFAVKVTGSVSGTVEANAILGRAAATAGLSVELSGSITGTGTFTDTFSASNTTSVQKHFIFYQGVRELTGTWTKWQCDRWETTAQGQQRDLRHLLGRTVRYGDVRGHDGPRRDGQARQEQVLRQMSRGPGAVYRPCACAASHPGPGQAHEGLESAR